MSGYSDELLTEQPAKVQTAGGYADELLDGPPQQSISSGPGPGKWKPLVGDSGGAGFFANLRAGLAPDSKTQIKRYSESMNIPENRFGVIDGDIVYWNPESSQYQRVAPSISSGDGLAGKFGNLGQNVAAKTADVVPSVVGGVVGAAMGPTGASIPAASLTASVTETARQALDKALAGEDVLTKDYDVGDIIGQGLLTGTGQGLGVLGAKAFNRNPLGVSAYDRTQAMAPSVIARAKALEQEAARRGVDLSAGQKTGLRSLLAKERQLGRFDETADMMFDFAQNQRNVQIPSAIRQEIGQISPKTGEAGIIAFRGAADDVVTAAKEARALAAEPLYTGAFQANKSVQSPVIDRILKTPAGRQALKDAATKMQNDMSRVGVPDAELTELARDAAALGKMDPVKGGVASGLKLRTLDYIKRAIGDAEKSALLAGADDNARILGNLRRGLTKELDRLDVTAAAGPKSLKPEGGLYAQARRMYGEGSDALETIIEGGTGFIKDMNGLDRIGIVKRVFDGSNMMPGEISRVRMQFQSAGKLDDWNAGLATWLSDKLDDSMKVLAQGTRGNVPGKFYARVWGDERQKEIVKAALGDPARVNGMEKLMEVLNAASKSLPEGSPTATDLTAMGKSSVGGTGRFIGKVLSPGTALTIGDDIVNGIAALRAPEARIKLAEHLLSKNALADLKKLRMLSPTGEKAAILTSQILTNAGVIQGGQAVGILGPRDFRAPAELDPTLSP